MAQPKLNAGDSVSIYRKPFTNEEFECNGILVERIERKGIMERWSVRFGMEVVARWIRVTALTLAEVPETDEESDRMNASYLNA